MRLYQNNVPPGYLKKRVVVRYSIGSDGACTSVVSKRCKGAYVVEVNIRFRYRFLVEILVESATMRVLHDKVMTQRCGGGMTKTHFRVVLSQIKTNGHNNMLGRIRMIHSLAFEYIASKQSTLRTLASSTL